MSRSGLFVSCSAILFASCLFGQTNQLQPRKNEETPKPLVLAETIRTAEVASDVIPPLRCDRDGNLYMKTEPYGVTGIRKLNSRGQSVTVFLPGSVVEEQISVAYYFSVDSNGEIYQLADGQKPPTFVIHFRSDGSYKEKIKIRTGFPWRPSALAVFPGNGSLLVTGQEYGEDKSAPLWPFTGIFSSDGTLLKEIKLEDDDALRERGVKSDPSVTNPRAPWSNRAIALSQMQSADDGNVYLMRWLTPAIFYAISPGGSVIRRFEVDPGDQAYRPQNAQISGSRIAIHFFDPQTKNRLLKIVDLEGRQIAVYRTSGSGAENFGGAFACYLSNLERFLF